MKFDVTLSNNSKTRIEAEFAKIIDGHLTFRNATDVILAGFALSHWLWFSEVP